MENIQEPELFATGQRVERDKMLKGTTETTLSKKYPAPVAGNVLCVATEICKHVELAKAYKAQIEELRESLKALHKNADYMQKLWEGKSIEAHFDGQNYTD
jgi:hypothetical protein